MTPINIGDIITFNYTGEYFKKKAMVKGFAYGVDREDKRHGDSPKMYIIALDLDLLKMKTFTIEDMSNIDVVDIFD